MTLERLELAEIERRSRSACPRFHGRQIFHWIHRRGVTDFDAMTDLAAGAARGRWPRAFDRHDAGRRTRQQVSTDGTTNSCCGSTTAATSKSVFIPDTPAQTFCISTQVGCAMACAFCLTGKMGLVRHLTAGEIAGQVRVLAHETGLAGTTFNIVLMGMGEPLHNYDATMKALRILADEQGLAVPSETRDALDGRRPARRSSGWRRSR